MSTAAAGLEPHVEDYLTTNEDLVLAPATIRTYRYQLTEYTDFLEEQGLTVLNATEDDVVAFIEDCVQRGNRRSTLSGKLQVIVQLYRHIHLRMKKEEQLELDPLVLEDIDLSKYNTPAAMTRDALSREELRKLFDAITSYRDRLIVLVATETGLRNSDLRELRVTDLDTEALELHVNDPKGGRPYEVPISEDLCFELEYWLREYRPGYGGRHDTDYLFPGQTGPNLETNGGLNHIVKEAAERAGIQDVIGTSELTADQQETLHTDKSVREWHRVTVHTLRHTFITLLKEAGVPLSYRQLVANHRSPSTTRGYSHGEDDAFALIRDRFDPPR